MSDLARNEYNRILLIKPSSPGDIIHALPVLRGLRQRYPAASISWLVAKSFANLISADPALDEVILFDRKEFARIGRSWTATRAFASFLRSLRSRRFDLVIDLQGLFRSGFFARVSGAGVRIGPAKARELAWAFYTDRIPPSGREAHAAERNYRVADMLGFGNLPMDFSIAVTPQDRRAVASLLKEVKISDPGLRSESLPRYAVLAPGTRWETKCWPAERYGQLANRLSVRHGLPSIVVGGKSDVELGRVATQASGSTAANLCGRTTLRQLAHLIDRAAIVVTGDSTPMHLAAALNRPLVALFGPTSPLRTGPYGRLNDVLRMELDCSPCYLRRLRQCPRGHECMDRLEVEMVAKAASRRLSGEQPA